MWGARAGTPCGRHCGELRADGVVLAERGRRPRLAAQTTITQPLVALYSLFASVSRPACGRPASSGLAQPGGATGPGG
jgi:hypothetical protein